MFSGSLDRTASSIKVSSSVASIPVFLLKEILLPLLLIGNNHINQRHFYSYFRSLFNAYMKKNADNCSYKAPTTAAMIIHFTKDSNIFQYPLICPPSILKIQPLKIYAFLCRFNNNTLFYLFQQKPQIYQNPNKIYIFHSG